MNFDFWLSDKQYLDGAIDLACFMLRFYTDIEYSAFTDKPILKRAEMYKCWSDLEELSNGVDILQGRFDEHEDTASKAFKEMFTAMETKNQTFTTRLDTDEAQLTQLVTKVDDMRDLLEKVADKTQNELKNEIMTEARSIVKVRMDEIVDLVEKFSKLINAIEQRQNEFETKIDQKYGLETERK